MIQIVWEFIVHPEHLEAFEAHYNPEGTWAKLFQQSPDFKGTVLLRDIKQTNRFVTIDTWTSRESFEAFKTQEREAYTQLDAQCEAWTLSEKFLGLFEVEQ